MHTHTHTHIHRHSHTHTHTDTHSGGNGMKDFIIQQNMEYALKAMFINKKTFNTSA